MGYSIQTVVLQVAVAISLQALLGLNPALAAETASEKMKFAAINPVNTVGPTFPAGTNKADYAYQGQLESSIYFNAVVDENAAACGDPTSNLTDSRGSSMMKVCRKTFRTCMMEGVCKVQRGSETRAFNYEGMINGRASFFELKSGDCVHGFGVLKACLDPFYTLAADLRFHRPGEVIYIPSLVGLLLPTGKRHSGFFVVRDVGAKIVGANRFDFFSGSIIWNDPRNPFFQAQLSGSKGKIGFYKVNGATARSVLDQRNYPKLPADSEMLDPVFGRK